MGSQRWNGFVALLRLAGAAILFGAALAGRALFGHAPLPAAGDATAADYVLALLLFVSASAGGALLVLGPRLLDQVEISARWSASSRRG